MRKRRGSSGPCMSARGCRTASPSLVPISPSGRWRREAAPQGPAGSLNAIARKFAWFYRFKSSNLRSERSLSPQLRNATRRSNAGLVADVHLSRWRMVRGQSSRSSARARHAFWLGSSVFDGARAFEGVTPDLDRHCARVNRSAKTMWLKPIMSDEAIFELAREGVKKFAPGRAALYPADVLGRTQRPELGAARPGIDALLPFDL